MCALNLQSKILLSSFANDISCPTLIAYLQRIAKHRNTLLTNSKNGLSEVHTQAIAHMHKNIHKHAHTFNFPLVQHSFPFSCSLDKGGVVGFIWIFRWTSQNLFTLTYTQMSFQILGQNNVYDNLAVVHVSISVCKSRITFTIAYHI